MKGRDTEQFGGFFLLTAGSIVTLWNWNLLLTHGYFFQKSSIVAPMAAVIGLGLLIFPGSSIERTERGEDIRELGNLEIITRRWWIIIAIAFSSGWMNLVLLET